MTQYAWPQPGKGTKEQTRRQRAIDLAHATRRYRPAPPPPVDERVADPDGQGWWDPSLTPKEASARIKGLARTLAWMERQRDTPDEWLVAELGVLEHLLVRAREGRA